MAIVCLKIDSVETHLSFMRDLLFYRVHLICNLIKFLKSNEQGDSHIKVQTRNGDSMKICGIDWDQFWTLAEIGFKALARKGT